MKTLASTVLFLVTTVITVSVNALPNPPPGKRWQLIENLSDEFENGFDGNKWIKNDPQWAGRKPGLFKTSQVSVQGGNLRITADMLPVNERKNGYTHAGGLVRSRINVPPSYGGYFEARMKANKTFMSSTFWLINKRNEGQGCDNRVTELDIVETVGANSGGKSWIDTNMRSMNSAVHSRDVSCGEKVGFINKSAPVGGLTSGDYHTYGAWWKSPTELVFYLDGVEKYTITPYAPFSLNMYLRMVVETYDWNPPPSGGGMNASYNDRTTYYDYVRSYRLVDDNNSSDRTPVPARIQAEDYAGFQDTTPGNSGGKYRTDSVDIESTTDAGGGYNIGWIKGNEWLEFPISVSQAGQYQVSARVASVPGNGMFTVEVDGSAPGNPITVDATGSWQTWTTKTTSLGYLSTGNKTIRVQVQAGDFNLNWIDIARVSGPQPSPSPTDSPSVDQCDTTAQCKVKFGNSATDCKNSWSAQSICMCGSTACQ